jgi:hypothetical protein
LFNFWFDLKFQKAKIEKLTAQKKNRSRRFWAVSPAWPESLFSPS